MSKDGCCVKTIDRYPSLAISSTEMECIERSDPANNTLGNGGFDTNPSRGLPLNNVCNNGVCYSWHPPVSPKDISLCDDTLGCCVYIQKIAGQRASKNTDFTILSTFFQCSMQDNFNVSCSKTLLDSYSFDDNGKILHTNSCRYWSSAACS